MATRKRKPKKYTCKAALRQLIDYCTSGRRYQTQNPYSVPEIKDAIVALGDPSLGIDSWFHGSPEKLSPYGRLQRMPAGPARARAAKAMRDKMKG